MQPSMAKPVTEKEESNVRLLTLEITEDELAVFLACLNFVLDQCDDETLDFVFGADRDEVEGMRDDLALMLDVPESDENPVAEIA